MTVSGFIPESLLNKLVQEKLKGKSWSELTTIFEKATGDKIAADTLRKRVSKQRERPKGVSRQDLKGVSGLSGGVAGFMVTAAAPVKEHDVLTPVHAAKTMAMWAGEWSPVVLGMKPHLAPLQALDHLYQSELFDRNLVPVSQARLAPGLIARDALINPQRISPLTSIQPRRGESVLLASPKQHLRMVAGPIGSHPTFMASTGCIQETLDYREDGLGLMARESHVCGARIVETSLETGLYHQRRIMFDEQAGFYDLGAYYSVGGEAKDVRAEVNVWGDLHFPLEDRGLMKAAKEYVDRTRPKRCVYHDSADNKLTNRHETGISSWAKETLEQEITRLRAAMIRFMEMMPEDCHHYFVNDNHSAFLTRWVNSGQFMNDRYNGRYGLKLAQAMADGKNLLQFVLNLPEKFKVTFLGNRDSLVIEGWECANHGHSRINGGPQQALDSIEGHTHSPMEDTRKVKVGHWSPPNHGYNGGPSTWTASVGSVYPGGAFQQIMAIPTGDGNYEWRGTDPWA